MVVVVELRTYPFGRTDKTTVAREDQAERRPLCYSLIAFGPFYLRRHSRFSARRVVHTNIQCNGVECAIIPRGRARLYIY